MPGRWRCRRVPGARARSDRSGSVAASPHAAPSRHETRCSATSRAVGDLEGPLDQPVRIVGRAGQAEVVERRRCRRTCRGWPGASLGRATRRRTPRPTPRSRRARRATNQRIRPPSPVGSTLVDAADLVGPRLQLRRVGGAGRRHDQRAQHRRGDARGRRRRRGRAAAGRRRRGRADRAGSSATGGPHRRAARSPSRGPRGDA